MKKKYPRIFAIWTAISASLLVSGCGKDCNLKSGNEGIIIREITELEGPCIVKNMGRFLLRSDSAYRDMFSVNCQNGTALPAIDFSQHSLLGLHASAGGCGVNFARKAERDDAEKKIRYTVETEGCGRCKEAGVSGNIVLIPAVPADYTAEFKVIEK